VEQPLLAVLGADRRFALKGKKPRAARREGVRRSRVRPVAAPWGNNRADPEEFTAELFIGQALNQPIDTAPALVCSRAIRSVRATSAAGLVDN
jgi:hypothetical protein